MPPNDREAPRGRKGRIDWDNIEWLHGSVDGSLDPDAMAYPGWLREQREAKRSKK